MAKVTLLDQILWVALVIFQYVKSLDFSNLDLPEGFGNLVVDDIQVDDTTIANVIEERPCDDVDCQNGATCVNEIKLNSSSNLPEYEAICQCTAGFSGDLCENLINECEVEFGVDYADTACNGRGSCVDNHGSYFCDCLDGFSGTNCEVDDFCTSGPGWSNPCLRNFECVEGKCLCNGPDVELVDYVHQGTTFQRKINGVIQFPETLDSNPDNSLGFYTEGSTCQTRDYCSVLLEKHQEDSVNYDLPCGDQEFNHCINKASNDGWMCSCDSNNLGHYCQYKISDFCPDNYCNGRGHCTYDHDLSDVDLQAIFSNRDGDAATLLQPVCYCDTSYQGDQCQDAKPCAIQNCNDRGTCINNSDLDAGYECKCHPGYEGDDCEFHACDANAPTLYLCDSVYSDVNSCEVDENFNGVCPCLEAPERTDCDKWGPLCHSSVTTCASHGTVKCDYDSDNLSAAVCTCRSRFQGDNCEIFNEKLGNCTVETKGNIITKELSKEYLLEVSRNLENDIINAGPCYDFIKTSMYDDALDKDIDDYEIEWESHFFYTDNIAVNRTVYAAQVKSAYYNAFKHASTSTAIYNKFCLDLINILPSNSNTEGHLYDICSENSWRFKGLLHSNNTEICSTRDISVLG